MATGENCTLYPGSWRQHIQGCAKFWRQLCVWLSTDENNNNNICCLVGHDNEETCRCQHCHHHQYNQKDALGNDCTTMVGIRKATQSVAPLSLSNSFAVIALLWWSSAVVQPVWVVIVIGLDGLPLFAEKWNAKSRGYFFASWNRGKVTFVKVPFRVQFCAIREAFREK